MSRLAAKLAIALALVFLIYIWPPGSIFMQKIYLDGQLEDWNGRASVTSPKDETDKNNVFQSLHWGTNENEQRLYFAVKLKKPIAMGQHFVCRLYLDIDDNGSYGDSIDKFAELLYVPDNGNGLVGIKLFSSDGSLISEYEGMWGQRSDAGGSGFEFYLPMAELNVYPAQPIRFYLAAAGLRGDRLPAEGDVQWKAFPVVVRNRSGIIIFALFWLVATAALYRYRIWPLYYILGAVGFTFIFILVIRGSFIEYLVEHRTGVILHHILNYFNVVTHVFDKSPGTILVFIKLDESWTTLDIDIESSALLEIAVLLGLVLFYPAYNFGRKVYYILFGTATLVFFNLLRLMLVISIIYWGGRNFNFVAHTLFGRIFFFSVIVILYWYILTRPSIKKVRGDVKRA
ncbi:MAG: hypothetical protein AB1796_07225 [Bacillota bacterium]